jgi:signal transduction histidine kinase
VLTTTIESVPLKALAFSLMALSGAIAAALLWPQALLDQEILSGGLALIPALLLAHYRGWSNVAITLGIGLVGLCALNLLASHVSPLLRGPFLILFVVTPYIAIALGAGWFGEVRRYQAELQTTQLQLIQSEKLDSLGRMAAGVAHEVKNPLMMILTGVKLLSRRLTEADESTRTLLRDMAEAVERADRIIGGLLSYAREHALELSQTDLNGIVDRSLLLVKHELDRARIAVVKELDGSMPLLTLDPFKIEQVFVNVLTNAVHAIERDGEIRVRTSQQVAAGGSGVGRRKSDRFARGERVGVVEIEDSGPGIRPEHLPKIFDPFFTTKPTGQGTGLGLSVSRQIVDLHGGTMEIGNRDDGGGARVTLTFKLEQAGETHGQATHSARR